jgi:hypothetical protein
MAVCADRPENNYYLVAPWRFGLSRDAMAPLDGKSVTLKGTLIFIAAIERRSKQSPIVRRLSVPRQIRARSTNE